MPEYNNKDQTVLKAFGAVVREKRSKMKISQEELAERSGLHRTYIGGIEQGRRNLSLLNILRVAHALESPPAELFKQLIENLGDGGYSGSHYF